MIPAAGKINATVTSRPFGRIAAVTAGAALLVGTMFATSGSAAADETAPPAQATAMPSTSLTVASGDAGRQYWASDHCHYYVQGGQWFSDQCAVVGPNSTIDIYQNTGDGQLGSKLVHVDRSDPQWVVVSTTGADGSSRAIRQSTSNPKQTQVQGQTQNGQPIWIDPPTQSSTTVGGPSSSTTGGADNGYDETPAQAQHRQQQAQINQTQQDQITCTIGCVHVVP